MKENNKKNTNGGITIKETSTKLDISESTIKKYLKDFDLSIEKGIGSKAIILDETFQALSEIVKLRANGLSIQEIKELKSQEPSKNILDEIDETKELKEEIKSENTLQKEEVVIDKAIKEENNEEAEEDIEEEIIEDDTEDTESDLQISPKEGEEAYDREAPKRRRLFNYRYIERQIANDSRRVGSLRQRLRSSNLSVQERLFVEEALERRILFLDGWKHILRWVSK